jgi:5-methylcytosine-specific restriction endonuclease McrA
MNNCLNCNIEFEINNSTSGRKKFFCTKECWFFVYQQRQKSPHEWAFLQFFVFPSSMAKAKLKEKPVHVPKPKGSSRPWVFNCFLEAKCSSCGKDHVRLLFTARPKRKLIHVLCWECSYARRKQCAFCKVEFSPVSNSGNSAAYCIPCRRSLGKHSKTGGKVGGLLKSRSCKWCLREFEPVSNQSNCCSRICSQSYNEYRRRTGKKIRYSDLMNCKCGKLIGKRFHKCMNCVLEDKDSYEILSKRRRYLAYRAGDRGISWRVLGKRDHWFCHLCGNPVTAKPGTAYVPDGATVDHIVPIAKNGTHTWNNVALAHRSCNVARGAKDLELLNVES